MKHQTLFSSKDKSKKNKAVVCCNFYFVLLRVKDLDTKSASNIRGMDESEFWRQ